MAPAPLSVLYRPATATNTAANVTEVGEMLAQLKQMDKDGTVDIIDAAVMVKAEDGRKLKVNETAEVTAKKGGVRGALVGGVQGIIFPPSIRPMAAVGAGGSVIVAVVEETWLGKLSFALEGYVNLARYALDAESAAKLTAALER